MRAKREDRKGPDHSRRQSTQIAGLNPAEKKKERRKEKGERKAAELWDFAAWYVRDGVGFNGSLVPSLGFSAKLMGEYLCDLPILRGNIHSFLPILWGNVTNSYFKSTLKDSLVIRRIVCPVPMIHFTKLPRWGWPFCWNRSQAGVCAREL